MKSSVFSAIISLILTHVVFAQGANLFDDTFLHEIRFSSMDTTLIDGSKVYQIADMEIDGAFLDSIGIREKGNLSNNVPFLKVPFKIKTNRYVGGREYDGIREFTLHNNFQDPSMMREKITYDLCAQLGLFALRSAYARVYINDKYWGLYTIVEGKDEMYKHRFGDRDIDAVESLDFGDMCFISTNPDDYNYAVSGLPYYQIDNGIEVRAFERFAEMIDRANNTGDAAYIDTVSQYLNLEHFFIYQALNVYLMNMDSYIAFRGNQIYAYDESENRFQIIPWDFNASLGLWNTNNATPSNYPIVPGVISSGCIASKLNSLSELEAYYFNAMCRLRDLCDPGMMNAAIDHWKAQISQAVYDDTRKTFTNEDFDLSLETGYYQHNFENVPALKTFFLERYNLINNGLTARNYTCNATDIVVDTRQPSAYALLQNYPNPFNATTYIRYQIEATGWVTLKIFDTRGALVTELIRSVQTPGHYTVEYDADLLPSGTYFYQLQVNGFSRTKKMLLLK